MASQAFIIARENVVIAALDAAKRGESPDVAPILDALCEALEAVRYERQINDGDVYPENRDYWGTLAVNAYALGQRCPWVARECRALVKAIGIDTPKGWDEID